MNSPSDRPYSRDYRLYNQQKRQRVLFDKWNVLVILKNPVYRGFVKYNGQLFPGKHAPLIDEGIWKQVQAIVSRHAEKRGRVSLRSDSTGGGTLTELAHCEHCGSRMHYQPSTSHTSRRYGYYRCAGCAKMICSARGVRSDKVEEQMRQIVGMMALPREWREEVINRAEHLLGDSSFQVSPERVVLEQQLAVLENARTCGLMIGTVYEEKRADLESRIAVLAKDGRQGVTTQELRAAAELLCNLPDLLAAAPIPEQRGVLRSVFEKVWVTRHNVCAIMPNNLYFPLAYAALQGAGMVSRAGFHRTLHTCSACSGGGSAASPGLATRTVGLVVAPSTIPSLGRRDKRQIERRWRYCDNFVPLPPDLAEQLAHNCAAFDQVGRVDQLSELGQQTGHLGQVRLAGRARRLGHLGLKVNYRTLKLRLPDRPARIGLTPALDLGNQRLA
jgi:hypothetical protein